MKKTIIIAAVILSTAVTAFCITRTNNSKQEINKFKIESSNFAAPNVNSASAGLASGD